MPAISADGAADFSHKHAKTSYILHSFYLHPNEDICAPLRGLLLSSSVSVGRLVPPDVWQAAMSVGGVMP